MPQRPIKVQAIADDNPGVDEKLLQEAQKALRALHGSGSRGGDYDLVGPFTRPPFRVRRPAEKQDPRTVILQR